VLRAERVPQRIGRIGDALVNLVVEGAVVTAVLRKQLRIEQRVIKTGVEDSALLVAGAFDGEGAELLAPEPVELRSYALEIPRGNLRFEILARLLDADERGADLRLYYPPG